MGEEQEGLGMTQGASQAPDGGAKFVAKPNISLERYSNNVVNDIKNQAKQELMQEITMRPVQFNAINTNSLGTLRCNNKCVNQLLQLDFGEFMWQTLIFELRNS